MPTDTSVKFIHSAMLGAPVLTGQAGSLIALLDAVLVNGFGTGGVDSIVIAGGVATVTRSAGHPFEVGSVALIAGAAVSGGSINGEQKVTAVTTTTYQFDASGIPNQTATGGITHKVAPLGWTKAFSGTNLAAYKPSDVTATGCLLRIDDTGTTAARTVGYESMTDINTGTNAFPTSSQQSGGLYMPKSASADSTARPWVLFGDGKIFYLAVSRSTIYELKLVFGDPLNVKSPDAYGCVINSDTSASPSSSSEFDYGDSNNAASGLYMARSYTGLGVPIACRKVFPIFRGGNGFASGNSNLGWPYPNYADGGLYVVQHYLSENTTGVLRATSPGLYCSSQAIGNSTFANRDYVSGVNGLPGKVLRIINTSLGCYFVDTTGPWR